MQEYCRTRLNYAGKSQYESVDVSILNGRLNEFSFDQAGFTMLDQKSGVSNWLDFEELTSVHMPEIAALSMGFAGCDVAVAYKPIIRSPS